MSHEIIYQRAFIRTTRGIIPTVLAGSNNDYEVNIDALGRNRQRRLRHWSHIYSQDLIELPEEKLLEKIASTPSTPDYTLFLFRNAWITGEQELSWFSAGCKEG